MYLDIFGFIGILTENLNLVDIWSCDGWYFVLYHQPSLACPYIWSNFGCFISWKKIDDWYGTELLFINPIFCLLRNLQFPSSQLCPLFSVIMRLMHKFCFGTSLSMWIKSSKNKIVFEKAIRGSKEPLNYFLHTLLVN